MRTELEFPIIDFSKIEEVKELIDAIAENMKDHSKELEKLNSITNKNIVRKSLQNIGDGLI